MELNRFLLLVWSILSQLFSLKDTLHKCDYLKSPLRRLVNLLFHFLGQHISKLIKELFYHNLVQNDLQNNFYHHDKLSKSFPLFLDEQDHFSNSYLQIHQIISLNIEWFCKCCLHWIQFRSKLNKFGQFNSIDLRHHQLS